MVEINDKEITMELAEYKNIYRNEGSHFFYVSTHYLIEKLVKKFSRGRRLTILDAGCGTGGLAAKMGKFGKVVGIDFSSEALKFARKRGTAVKKASVDNLLFKHDAFDLVTSIDVIYHKSVKDDMKALKEIRRVLKPNGTLILRVPANKFLLSAHDRHVHTARRYGKSELVRKLAKAGFEVRLISFVHSILFPISLVKVMLEKTSGAGATSTIGRVNPILNAALTALLKFEACLIASGASPPFGQGLIAVAQPTK